MKNLYLILFFTVFTAGLFAQTAEQRAKYTGNFDLVKIKLLKESIRLENERNFKNISKHNFPLSYSNGSNSFSQLQGVTDDGFPIYFQTNNNGSGTTIKAASLYLGGGLGLNVQGQNMIAGVWDGGSVRLDHEHFQNRVIQRDFSSMALSAHATHVTGTICQNKTTTTISRGMAFNADVWANDWTNDSIEVIDAAFEGLLVSNHSYGFGALNAQNVLQIPLYYFGAYIQLSRNWDLVLNQYPNYLMVTSAGNDRDSQGFITNKGGYDLLSGMKTCKNNITVGAINNIAVYNNASSPIMSNFSNWGPIDDGRIKPDLVAKGVSVSSTTSTGATSATATMSGTSMASPSVTGGLLLLQQYYNAVVGNYMLAATLKGLALHTTSEAGLNNGPDYEFGWGVLNCEAAANLISSRNTSSRIQELTLTQGQTITINLSAIASSFNPLSASISWNDPAGTISTGTVDSPTPALVNDLDIKVSKGPENFFPWKLDPADPVAAATKGINNVDVFEKVQVDNPTGNYTITITHKGTLQAPQKFSLILSGVNQILSNSNFDSDSNFFVYPNPTSALLNFSNPQNIDFSSISIIDVSGKEIKVQINNNQIDVSGLQSGVYFVKFTSENKSTVKKFIKQ